MTSTSAGKRIVLLIGSDGIGGIERRLSILISAFEAAGVSCSVVALASSLAERGLLHDHKPRVLDSKRSRAPWRSLRRWWRLRQLLIHEQANALFCFGHFANALGALAAVGTGTPTILSEIVAPYTRRRRWWNRTMIWSYRLADVMVVQTARLAQEMQARSPLPRRTIVIANPLHPDAIVPHVDTDRAPLILGLGRLVRHKRYDDLITAFARIADEFPEWRVRIVGDGPERSRLQTLVDQLGMASRIALPGATTNPWPVLREAAILAHCAEIEGFPNTILEGLASGCVVVASDCPYGPREILTQGRGLLFPTGDIEALTGHLRHLLGNPQLRMVLANAGHASCARFNLDANLAQWLSLIPKTPRRAV